MIEHTFTYFAKKVSVSQHSFYSIHVGHFITTNTNSTNSSTLDTFIIMRRWGLFIFHILFVAGKMTIIIMFFGIFNNIAVLKCILCLYLTIFYVIISLNYVYVAFYSCRTTRQGSPASSSRFIRR